MTQQALTVQNKAIYKTQDPIPASCFIYPIKINHKLTSCVGAGIFLKLFEYASLQLTLFFYWCIAQSLTDEEFTYPSKI